MLIDDADIAQWNNEGLPGDRMSVENATILTNCDRWPLMIDPQLQGGYLSSFYFFILTTFNVSKILFITTLEIALNELSHRMLEQCTEFYRESV